MVLALALSATHCSLLTSVDGLAGGAAPDASGAGDSGSIDASGADGDAALSDGAVDASPDGGRYCATSTATLCDDFDDEGPFAKWSSVEVGAGAVVVRDRAQSVSSPSSLLTSTPASPDSVPAYLRYTTPTPVRRVRVAYDLRVDARDSLTAYVEVGYIRFGASKGTHAFYFRLGAGPQSSFAVEAYLPDGGIPQNNVALTGDSSFANWTRVAIDYDLRSPPHVSVSIDGKPAGDVPLDASQFTPDVARIDLGVGYLGHPTSDAWKLRYDNVTIDTTP